MTKIKAIFQKWFGGNPVEDEFRIKFSQKALLALIIPLIAEQFLGMLMGIADTIMVSSLGDAAVSGVSLVDMIFILFFNVLNALATGGAIISSRAVGENNPDKARRSASCLVLIAAVSSVALMIFVYAFDKSLLRLLFGTIEDDVMSAAVTYMRITLISFPAVALYNSAAALFRAIGNSKISMITQTAVNVLNIAGNAVFIFVFKWGIAGAALATLLGRLAAAAFLLVKLADKNTPIRVDYKKLFREKPDSGLMKNILSIGVPSSLENGTFQLGKILVLSVISGFGTAQITANAVGNNMAAFGVMTGFAYSFGIVTIVGQCVGAGDWRAVKYYAAKLIRLSYLTLAVFNALLFAALPLMLSFYSVSDEARELAILLIFIHNGFAVLFWTPAFVLPNAMKAVGDAKFVMVIAILSMFIFRVGFSYILGVQLGLGAIGVWLAMIIDWIFRTICFFIRWKQKMKAAELKYEN